MSAYLVTDEHINVMVHALDEYSDDSSVDIQRPEPCAISLLGKSAKSRVGQVLRDENVRSVNDRYGDNDMVFYEYNAPTHDFSPVEVLKAVSCYEYQSCDSESWKGSLAAAICSRLRDLAIASLPGYDEAAWDISRDTNPIAA